MSYTINPNAKNRWARNAENTMDLSLETDASSVYLDNGRTLEQEIGEGSMVSNVAAVDNAMSKVIDGTLDGAYESLVFKGKSLVNLANKSQENAHYTDYNLSYIDKTKTYFIKVVSTKAIVKIGFIVNNTTWNNSVDCEQITNGYVIIKPNETLEVGGLRVITSDSTTSYTLKTMIIEYQEGMENWDIPYFTGLCDVKMPILRNVSSIHPSPNGLLCWYDARSGEGEQILLEDLSGNENHATLRNFQFGGTDGWQDGGIRIVGYGAAKGKNSIRTNKQINNAKSMCIYFKRLRSTDPWYLFDGRESSTLYWYSGGYSGINRSNSSKNGVQLSGNNDAVLPEIGNTAMVYIEFTDNIPITPTLMGRYSGNESLDGVFYAFMLYDRALTTEEVAMNMEYAKSFDHIKDISPLDFRNIDKTNILRTSEEIVLREVNEVQDTYNPLTGEYVRRIGEVVLDGSENWSQIALTNKDDYLAFGTPLLPKGITTKYNTNNIIDSHGFSKLQLDYADNGSHLGEAIIIHNNGNLYFRMLKTRLSTADKDGWLSYLQLSPITVQYKLAEPITTIVESLTTPFAYENGHVILESGHEGQSLLPTLEYSTVVNKTGLVENVAKTIQRQEKQLTMLEQMLIQNIINLDYNNTLLTLKNEMEEIL